MGGSAQDKSMQDRLITEGIDSLGYGTIAKLVMKDTRIKIGAKALYAYICSYAGAGTVAFPGRQIICHDLGINKDTYQNYLKELIKYDYIRVIKERQQGRFTTNTYIIVKNPNPAQEVSLGTENYQENTPCPKNPDTVIPCPKKSDTKKSDTEKPCPKNPDTNINSNNINSFKINIDNNSQQQQSNNIYNINSQEETSSRKDNVVVVDPLPGEQSDKLKEIRDFCRQESLDLFVLLTEDAGYMAELLRMAGGDTGVIKDALLASWQYYQKNDVPNLKGLVRQAVADRRKPSPAAKQRKGRQKDKFKMLYV